MTETPLEPTSGSEPPHVPVTSDPPFGAPEAPVTPEPVVSQPLAVQPAPAIEHRATVHTPKPLAGDSAPATFFAADSVFGAPDEFSAAPSTTDPVLKKKSRTPLLVAAIAVVAVVGGAAGAGISGLISGGINSDTVQSGPAPQNLIVNNVDAVNVITAVAAKAEPSVVTISSTAKSSAGTGSGVILSADGYVLTNTHVVTLDGASSSVVLQVTTSDGRVFPATLVGTDPIADLAVIKIKDATGLTAAVFGDSDKLNVGQTAVAIGAPLGLSNTVTKGIVSALNRSISVASSAAPESESGSNGDSGNGTGSPFNFWQFDEGKGSGSTQTTTTPANISLPVIQTDAAINPGNSGGALLNANAQVIGINVAIASTAGASSTGAQSGNIGVGFAIPSNFAKRVANEIIKTGSATHGLLGAAVTDMKVSSPIVGSLLDKLTPGGAADKAGLKTGDLVTKISGVPIASASDLMAQVRSAAGGATVSITRTRDGKSATVSVTLGTLTK